MPGSHKLLAGRIIDQADVAALLRANRETLDLDYVKTWLSQLKHLGDFESIWHEAFPADGS